MRLGRVPLLYTLLFCLLKVCWGAVTVVVTPTLEALKGETATLPCSFTVSPLSDNTIVEWFIDEPGSRVRVAFKSQTGGAGDEGTKLSGRVSVGEDFSLIISPTRVDDERSFHCQVTAGASGVGEGTSELKVFNAPDKPEVSGLSDSIIIQENSVTEIGRCVCRNGHPEPRIVWYKDSNPLQEITEVNNKMYMVSSVVREVTGLFTMTSTLNMQLQKEDRNSVFFCRVEYAMLKGLTQNKDSETFSLPIHYPTEQVTLTLMTSGPVKEGDNVEIRCEADGNPKPEYDLSFKKEDGEPENKDAPGGILTLPSVTRDDAGLYRCEALDFDAGPEAQLIKELSLLVHYLDPIKVSPASPVVASVGEKVELTCETKASDKHTLQWKKGSSVLSETGTLTLEKVSLSDMGVYTCVATVPSVPGLQAQEDVTVSVPGKPEIVEAADAEVEKEGDQANVTCSAMGYPLPEITWKPKHVVSEHPVAAESRVSSHQLVPVTPDILKDGVTCEATNEHGTVSKQLKISISKVITTEAPAHNKGVTTGPIDRVDKQEGSSSGVVIAVVLCLLLLLLLALLLFFLWKKGKLPCGKKEKSGGANNGAAVEMSSDKSNEEKGLLNKPPAAEQ